MANLTLERLDKLFGTHHAIDALSLDVPEGNFVSFLGPSGCGKTTTLRCIAGLELPTSGRILFSERDVTALPPEKRNIGMVFQNYALFPHMTVTENVGFGLEMRSVPKPEIARRVARVLEMVQLPQHGKRYPSELSGGQQQRVALARALVVEPEILLLDEPLANLDARLRDEMRAFIREVQQSIGITTIYVTHDQAEAMTMSDQVVVMFDGKLHQQGRPQDIYARPATERVADFIGAANLVSAIKRGPGIADTDFAALGTSGGEGVPIGGMVRLVLRPEDLQLGQMASESSFPVTVTRTDYLGNSVHYTVRTDTGAELAVHALGMGGFGQGERAHVTVTGTDTWILP